jgi:hypothetical protein
VGAGDLLSAEDPPPPSVPSSLAPSLAAIGSTSTLVLSPPRGEAGDVAKGCGEGGAAEDPVGAAADRVAPRGAH